MSKMMSFGAYKVSLSSLFKEDTDMIDTRVIFYVRRIGLYLYEYKIYGTISIYILAYYSNIIISINCEIKYGG